MKLPWSKPAAPAPGPSAKPLIDDGYWFEKSKDMVGGATTARTEAADKLQSTIGWFWTVYAAGAVFGVAAIERDYPVWAILLIGLPVLALVVAYWLASWVRIPITVEFDPRAPDEIRDAHLLSAKVKRGRLVAATVWSALGAFLVVVAIFVAAFAGKESKTDDFTAALHQAGPMQSIVVGGDFPPGTKVVVVVSDAAHPTTKQEAAFVTSSSGELHQEIPIGFVAETYNVAATWEVKDVGTRSLTKVVEAPEGSTTAPGGTTTG